MRVFLIIFFIALIIQSCGEDCYYGCEVPTLPDDCSKLTDAEIRRFDQMSISYLENDKPTKSLEILECFRDSSKIFNNVRKLRWLVSRLEVYGFDTGLGVFAALSSIAEVISSGSTTSTAIDGVPNINDYNNHAAYRLAVISPILVVYNSINASQLDSNQQLTLSSLEIVLAIYLLNSYAYPNPSIIIGGVYPTLETSVTTADENFITENLVCNIPGAADDCPNGSEPALDPVALILANAFYQP